MPNTYLKVPNTKELHYRQEWMKDPRTMEYNKGFDIDLKGYDKETGTITKTDEEMISWYNNWINKEPDKFFAYIYDSEITEPIGEVYYYPDGDVHSMGILISYKYRGKGYSYPALLELEKIAFEKNNISELSDMMPLDRISAIKTFKKAGFIHTDKKVKEKIFDKEVEVRELLLTKEDYIKNKHNK
jgi:RimJ/RimL family protein N-acetyltransferase